MKPDEGFLVDVENEYKRARSRHAPMHSYHEAYAIILEELDEFWEHVRKYPKEYNPDEIYNELVQIAAMALSAATELAMPDIGARLDSK